MDLTGQAIDNMLLSKIEASIGTYRDSDLDIATFNLQNMGTWMLCNGQSSVGTEYETLTGKAVVPNFVTEGSFRRQAKAGRSVGSHEADENKSHKHNIGNTDTGTASLGNSGQRQDTGSNTTISTYNYSNGTYYYTTSAGSYRAQPTGGDETRPKNVACNVFIKVNHI